MELAFDAMIGKTNEEIALRMKTLYHDGSGFELDGRRFSVWFDPSGIQMAAGDRARYANNAQVISWTDAAKRVGELIEAGQFGTQLENVEAPGTIRRKVAERLIYMYRDSAARENGYLSLMTDTPLIFPDCVNHLSEKMEQPEFLRGLIRQMEVFADAVTMQPDLMRFRFLLPKDILPRLRDLALARKELPEGEMLLPDVRGFMTQDEIDAVLTQSAPIAGADSRIYQFFSAPHSTNEKLEFLKNEYGIGGKMPGVSGEHGSSESHDAKGIQLRKSNCPDVLLKWNQVAERIDGLIQMNRYLTPEKQALYEKKEVQDSARNTDYDTYNSIKAAHPDEIVLFQVGDFFELYDEDARQAAENLGLNLTSRNLEGVGRVAMCKIPAHSLEQYVEQLRDKVDVTIAEKRENSAAYHVYTLLSVDHEAENAINAYEAEFGADGTRVFRDSAIEQQTQPTMQAMHGNLQSKQGKNEQEQNPNYRLLSRLKADCDYFLDAGGRAEKYLWAGNVRAQIAKMREIYETLPAKPEWLTKEAIDDYDEQMTPQYQVVVYHHFENGFDEKIEYQTLEEAIKVAQGYVNGTMESDGFAYDGAAVYNHQEHRYLYIYGHYPDEKAHAQVEGRDFPEQPEEVAVTQESESPSDLVDDHHPPMPPYQAGDTVYLGNTAFIIEEVTDTHVTMRDPTLLYPISRIERRDVFERMLAEDARNAFRFDGQAAPAQTETDNPKPPDEQVRKDANAETSVESEAKIEQSRVQNFRITDDQLGEGGAKTKYAFNIAAIQALKQIEAEGRQATPQEQEILSKYVGWGGLPQAFDVENSSWQKEYQQLKSLLTDEEYAAARGSTLNAHYTSPTVIKAMYDALGKMGFQSGNILEPSCGVGNFFGCLPETMQGSKLYGVELDSITGRIAQQLYPDAKIEIKGFEKTSSKDFFDVAVGNVPFGNYKVADRPFDKYGFLIHDYFFAKTLEQVRPGGIIAYITSKGTMDKASPDVRRYIAQRAELLGAIRLPNNAFKANAGTEVTSDILFLQKREHPIDIEPDWIHLGQTADGIPVNSYFVDHPDMMLGRMQWDKSMYGNEKETTCEPIPGADLAQQLHAAVRNIDGEYKRMEISETDINEGRTIPADPDVRNFSYALVNGQVYYRENSVMTRPVLNQTTQERVKGMIELRDCVRKLIDLQLTDGSDAEIRAQQEELGRLYDAFSAEYGIINGKANGRAFEGDSSYYLLCSLEILDEDRKLKRKADIFSKRTIRRRKPVTQVDTASEALAVSIGEQAKVDLPFMARLTGKAEDEIVADLQGVIFLDPLEQTWQTADEYLSGNVRAKLRVAQTAAESDSSFAVNVEALQAAQPKDLDASEIDVRLGTTWVDKAYIQRFMIELLGIPYYERRRIHVNYAPQTAEWSIDGKSLLSENVNNYMKYGTRRAPALKILEDTLNLRDTRVYDVVQDENGRDKRELNQKETTIAQQKQQAIKDAFHDWVWKDPTRRHELVTRYNELFNSTRPREYDGSHIVFDGMNPEITLREHQRNAIAHVLYGGNTLLAHQVGAGKTFEMVAAAMESKRLGLCQKSMFVVPNHLTEQWASEFLRLYPSANILVTTKKDFEKAKRKQFCARIATGDYDAVIIGHSQFEKIPISQERQERLLREQIDEIAAGIEEMERENGERFTIKRMEATRKSLEARLEKLKADEKKDDVVTFEELGVDRLFVDEAHAFKNGFLATKMRNVAGIATSESQKSTDMFLKCRYMDELTGGRGVIFATGTPVSNSMTELYTMQRYLQYGTLEKMGLIHFDAWASTFGETVTAIELAPEGTGYRARTRFAKFFNLPELMAMFKEVADIKTADQLHLPVPNAHYETMAVKPSVYQEEMVEALSERASKVHSGAVDPKEDNMLRITSDGRKLGLDQRLMNPLLPDEPGSKVNACMENILRIYKEGDAQKLTQLVFCDLSTPHGDGSFNVYDDIRDKLVASGIPKEEIQFIHDADTEIKKKELFARVRSGQVRILFGSTQKLGAGTNVQDRLIALHDLDAPWRPGDLEQRAGRIVRQGNMNPDVHIYRYVTEKSFDSYLWQTIENKQRFISQIMSSKSPVRACDDVDETALSYAEIKALCAGDPRIKEKMDLDIEVAKLRLMKADYQSNQFKLEDQILKQYPEEIRQAQERAKGYRADMALLEAHPLPKDGFVGMAIKEKRIADKEEAGKMLLEACRLSPHDMELGEYRGMKMTVDYDSYRQEVKLVLRGEMSHTVTMGTDVYGNLTRIENALANMPQKLEKAEERIAELERQMKQAKAEPGKPFAQEKELEAKAARLAELNAALNIDEKRKEPMEKRPMKDVLKAYQERADAQRQGEKGGTNEWNR
ncbi:MAG: LPD11 domain-containing protein [Christensenellales bacterium]